MDYINSRQTTTSAAYDQGLRAFMLKVYNIMCMGIGLTGLVSYFAASTPALLQLIFSPGINFVVAFAPLVFILCFASKLQTMTPATAKMLFWVFATLMGLSLTGIFLAYTGESIFKTFLITSSMFGSMSIYGHTTKTDLSKFGSFLMMGFFGLLIASVVNFFAHSSALSFAISVMGVLIFTGLTAYDTQKIKAMYASRAGNQDAVDSMAVSSALMLYMDFINLFLFMLRFVGNRR